ncbi:hypothetical protein [Streptomyces sp. NPDC007905]|uniref:hypothetical protein n=1 Tax=Streptomyces sp. NPDC007905 TaxID=3364788 RepID=UPI0036E260CA
MDPQIQGALWGAGATALGGAIGWLGARSQARASLEAVRMQVRGQRFDAHQQSRREAHAAYFGTVEEVRMAVAHARGVMVAHIQHPEAVVTETPAEARRAVNEALKRMWFQQSLLRLSVSSLERMSAESLAEQMTGLVRVLDEWWAAALRRDAAVYEVDERLRDRSDHLVDVIDYVMDQARSWLEADPVVDRHQRRLWERLWSGYHDWRLRNVMSD